VSNGYVVKDEFRTVRDDDVTVQNLIEQDLVEVRDTPDETDETDETNESGEPETCQVVKSDGEVCGRDRPCRYHD